MSSDKPSGSKSFKSDVLKVWEEIERKVKSTPTMVFSVIGDSESFVPRPWAKSVFQTALIEAAKSGGDTWILYRGYNYGVSSVVRSAYGKYGDTEFRANSNDVPLEDSERKVKLIYMPGHIEPPKTPEERSKVNQLGDVTEENLDEDSACTSQERNNSTKNTLAKPSKLECYIEPTENKNFVLDFEEFVSKQELPFLSQTLDLNLPIPIVILACEGDINTIEHISEALKRKIPVIIIKGSGKAADLILDYMENKQLIKKKASVLFGIRFNEIAFKTLTRHLSDIVEASDLVGVFDVNNDNPLMLSNTIGEGIVSCWATEKILSTRDASVRSPKPNTQREKTLQLTTSNGNAHIGTTVSVGKLQSYSGMPKQADIDKIFLQHRESRAYVLDTKYSSPTSLPLYFFFEYQFLQQSEKLKEHGHMLLFEALIANRCDYVRVLLDQGVRFRLWNLSELYEQTVSCKDCHFEKDDCLHIQWLLKQIEEKKAEKLCFSHRKFTRKIQKKERKNREALKKLQEMDRSSNSDEIKKLEKKIKDRKESIKENKEKLQELVKNEKEQTKIAESAKGLCRKILGYKESEDTETNDDPEDTENDAEEKSSYVKISDILLWAIFANRKEIAEICWLRGKDHLLTALVCAAVLKKLSKKANNVKEQNLSNEFAEHTQLFENRCLTIMDGMYKEDDKNAIDIMDDDTNVWGIKSSPLTFAHENFMYDVVAHTCSQKNMNKQWYNKLAPDLKPFLKSMWRKPRKFFTAPLTRYMYNYVMFFVMLVFYSAFVLTSIGDEYYILDIAKMFEYYVYFWGAGDLIEELISCFGCLESRGRSHRGYYARLKRYLYDFWNLVDLLSYALLITALCVRHFHPSTNFTIARRMFSLSLLVMYLRFLEVFLVHRKMGPTLIMIKEMLKDLLYFLGLAVFVVLGVGMYYHANLWPDHPTIWSGNWVNWRIWTIIYYPYWQLYGEINNEFLEGQELDSCTQNETIWKADTSQDRCPQEDWTVIAVAGFYMLFSNLLLVNLVIAMFSYTFERVQENAEKLWRFHRCTVISDYEWRIPSPINIIFLPYRICCCPGRKGGLRNRLKGCCNKKEYEEEKKKELKRKEYRKHLQRNMAFKIFNKM